MSQQLNDYTNEDELKRLLHDLERLQPEQRSALCRLLGSLNSLDTEEKDEIKLLLEGLDCLSPEQRKPIFYRVPTMLRNLIAVFEAELKTKLKEPEHMAQRLIIQLAHYLGGMQTYLPTNDRLKTVLRNIEIFNKYNKGKSIRELSAAYKVSQVTVYNIINDLTKAERARRKAMND